MSIIIIAVLTVIFLLLWACLDIVPQAESRVIERLGMFHAVWNAGVHVKIPILDRAVVPHIDMREQILELPRSYSYRKDETFAQNGQGLSRSVSATNTDDAEAGGNATTRGSINSFGVARANASATAETTVRAKIFGVRQNRRFNYSKTYYSSDLDAYHSDFRDVITKDNVPMEVDAAVFYQVTDPKQYVYGMKQPLFALQKLAITNLRNIIGTLELDETLCSRDFINSKLRASLDEATDSWGIKITRVEIESILPPDNIREAMEEQARAERFKRAEILRAEGELRKRELEALGNKALNENAPNDSIIRLKAIQGMVEVSKGQATKIIIPSEMQGLVGLANGITEGVRPGAPATPADLARKIDQ